MPEATRSWRFQPSAVLPLAFLLAIGLGLTELSIVYLLRSIHCDSFKENHPEIIVIPELDVCRLPEVQRLYSRDLSIYFAISTVLSIILSGPYGKLSDKKGRRHAMLVAASITAVGDAWLCLSALDTPLRNPWSIYFSAILKGFGGGFAIMNAVHSAFVADTSSTASRSFHMGLVWIMYWMGAGVSPVVSAVLMEYNLYVENFATAAATWILYLGYVALVLPETLSLTAGEQEAASPVPEDEINSSAELSKTKWRIFNIFYTFWDPVRLIFGHPTLRWLGVVSFTMLFAVGAFSFLVPYCDGRFGLDPIQAGLITAVMTISRAISVLCILPLFVVIYRRFINRPEDVDQATVSDGENGNVTERTPLLAGDSQQTAVEAGEAGNSSSTQTKEISAAQELVICRIGFLLDALGMLFTWRSNNATEVALSTVVGSLGAAAGPSLQSLVTLAAAPDEMGRVLAGKSALESAAIALRSPAFYALFDATLETMPGSIWLLAAGMLAVCAMTMMFLRSRQFIM